MFKIIILIPSAIFVFLTLQVPLALAAEPTQGVRPGGGRIVECVLAHQSEFSAPCRAKITEGFAIIGENP